MKHITIFLGSVRMGRTADSIAEHIQQQLADSNVRITIADPRTLQLPFFDAPVAPADDTFSTPHEQVGEWRELVASSDAIIMLTPEYNSQLSAVQKNAIDWLYHEWKEKPIGIVSYGWRGGVQAAEQLEQLLGKLGAQVQQPVASLYFTKDIAADGQAIDTEALAEKLQPLLTALS